MESDRLDQLLEFWGREQRDTILRCLRRVAEDAEASPWRSPTLSLPEVQEVMNPWEQPFHQELLYEYLDALDMWEVYALYITAKAGNPEFDLRSALKKPPTRMQVSFTFII
ncbi:hypothetical protein N7462_011390 [Penicillium macrosclerotiorum]|uniref:uncharacterized protein n=1 Tax=Penicillium macrosclerotiorum TaxID=303699 RepID=UPI002548A56F|nr:uncharacterized protein N7462_011390 [Penicillium macrosclerotiorum]KAJ5666981.1 hypothetical protein N7462_011390 [Penicillium macrosclerotiorum]